MKRNVFLIGVIVFMIWFLTIPNTESENLSLEHRFINRVADILKPYHTLQTPPNSIIIAQAILESGWGESSLSRDASNYFGIKGDYNGKYVNVPTQEYTESGWVTLDQPFKKYPDLHTSVQDYLNLMQLPRYAGVLQANNYKDAAYALVEGGYATDPNYAQKLIELIETYDLNQFDH